MNGAPILKREKSDFKYLSLFEGGDKPPSILRCKYMNLSKNIMKQWLLILCMVLTACNASHQVTLTPVDCTIVQVPVSGITQVSDNMFYALVGSFCCGNRVYSERQYKFKSFVLFSCDEYLERGKIFNITDEEIVVHTKFYYAHDVYEEDIVVKPRTFNRIISGGCPWKIECYF